MDSWLLNLTRVAALASGLMAGLSFAFSAAIMPALERDLVPKPVDRPRWAA